jgi:copper chaperone
MTTVTYNIPSIHCGHCVHTIKMEVSELEGVQSVQVDEAGKQAVITFGAPATEDNIIALLKEINYPPAGQDLIQLN